MDAISSPGAPQAIGPYSQAIRTGDLLFTSGQIGLESASGALVAGGIVPETHQVFQNLRAVLTAAGGSLADIVRATVYLADMAEFAEMNAVYESYVGAPPPARSTVGVASLPRGARVEIDVIARLETARR
jgi:2-iminobutanoate/2-iminopropanoate deaminase